MRKRNEQPEDTFADAAAPPRLTPMDVQQKEFGVTRVGGGYRMRDVDQFLDELTNSMTALVEENRRLKEQAGSGAMIGAPDLEQVSRQADEIIRRAREEAAQIVRDAHSATVAAGSRRRGRRDERRRPGRGLLVPRCSSASSSRAWPDSCRDTRNP